MADVVVVGASVAGASTAIDLARRGYSVTLLDRAQFPRRKPCGEGLFPQGVAELESLGLLPGLLDRFCQLSSLRFNIDGRSVEAPLGTAPWSALGVQRDLLDNALVRLAETSGVDVCLGTRVNGLLETGGRYRGVGTVGGEVAARVIVAADGAQSRLRREAGLDAPSKGRRYGVSAHFEASSPVPSRVDVHFRRGYEVYITPVSRSMVNVAVLLSRDRASRLAGRLPEGYQELVASCGALPDGAQIIDEPMASGPFPVQAKRAWGSNLVLVGDAAGFFDGVTGEGMSLALVSARHCADAIDRFLKVGDASAFKMYDQQRRDLARNSAILGGLTLALAAHPRLGAFAVRNLAKHPGTFSRLLEINQGASGFSSLRPRDVLALVAGV